MKKHIENRDDIILLINSFYNKVKTDNTIGYLFNDIAKVNWEKHLPVMYDFWENVIFFTGTYTGNPMVAHSKLHAREPLTKEHFQKWLHLFTETVDELFDGDKAEFTKQRALSIATVMQIKISQSQS